MIQIPLSVAMAIAGSAEAFTAGVAAHRNELEAHRLGKPGIAAPLRHELIDQLVQRIPDTGPVAERQPDQFVVAPFEIIDDSPTLAERKALLLREVHTAGSKARDDFLSPARHLALSFDVTDSIAVEDGKRSPAQVAALELYESYHLRANDISRAIARAGVEIEDLTEASIGSYQPPAF